MTLTSRGLLRFFIFVVGYVLFLALGAVVFSAIEGPEEVQKVKNLRNLRSDFLTNHRCVSDQALEDLLTEVVKASNRGVSAARNASGEPNWSFGQSLFFSSTVVTTIGYGHVTPLSRSGKVFCMLYAVVGIPLTLVLLSALVERLLIPTIWLLQWLNSRLGHLYQPFNIRLLHLFIIVLILVGLFLIAPATVFATIEPEWDFLDSFYYCFISLTTIGLGDYIPGDSPDQPYRPLYKIATTGYLFLGITFMMLTLAVFYDIPQLNLGLLFTANDDSNSEKVRLAGAGQGLHYGAGGTFSPQSDDNNHRQVVRVRSRRDDSPSPEEGPIKELRLP
ncbi:potassium channel subfamily K member 1-like isoform X2 [Aethina tumida]|uniref:potassium channel subfamily K member 1-like isoform X2 n=1 Tax=Aethina tumida TaxID=116153 RepID=UPI0021487FE9|nr:potassium channel subfamily K member 1-like isoform X2 [Aethina tumida]XP_049820322.1 potassium channel subfamily K member 1-like isoform X2 [Aethina tumida]